VNARPAGTGAAEKAVLGAGPAKLDEEREGRRLMDAPDPGRGEGVC
jgi:hypothetical protein